MFHCTSWVSPTALTIQLIRTLSQGKLPPHSVSTPDELASWSLLCRIRFILLRSDLSEVPWGDRMDEQGFPVAYKSMDIAQCANIDNDNCSGMNDIPGRAGSLNGRGTPRGRTER